MITFEEFKELLQFSESEDIGLDLHHFRALLQVQARRSVDSEIFDADQEYIRAYVKDELAQKIWDLCLRTFGPTYTVEDLKYVYRVGMTCPYGNDDFNDDLFDKLLREIDSRKGKA